LSDGASAFAGAVKAGGGFRYLVEPMNVQPWKAFSREVATRSHQENALN
jgi:hypothetical protein